MAKYTDYIVDDVLTNYAVSQFTENLGFIADEIAPVHPVDLMTGTYPKWTGTEGISDDVETLRAHGDIAKTIKLTPTTGTFTCKPYALRYFFADDDLAYTQAQTVFQLEQQAVRVLVMKLRLQRELAVKAKAHDDSIGSTTVSNKWDGANADIEADIEDEKETFEVASGLQPTHIVIPRPVLKYVKRDSSLRELRKYVESNLLENSGALPVPFLELIPVVPGSIRDTANPAQSASNSRVWSEDKVVLAHVNSDSGFTEPTAFKQFRVRMPGQQVSGEQGAPTVTVRRYRDEERKGYYIEVEIKQAEAIIAATAARMLDDCLS